jgi:chromate transporter
MAGMLTFPLIIVLALMLVFTGVSDLPQVQGALRGMGAVAAGLITATGLKLLAAIKLNPMGMAVCWLFAALTFVAIALLRLPLIWVLLGVGSVACLVAYQAIRRVEGLSVKTGPDA